MEPTNRRGGFTLVELMIVVAVIGLVGLVAVPNMFAYLPGYRVDQAVKVIATETHLARTRAIARNATHHIAFDPTAQTLTIFEDADNNWATANTVVKTISIGTDFPNVSLGYNAVTGLGGTTLTAAAEFGTTASPVRAVFLPNGLAADPGEFYLLPTGDVGVRSDRLRGIQVSRGGQIERFRYDTGANAWEAY